MAKTPRSKNPASFQLPIEPIVPSVPLPQAPQLSLAQAMKIAERHQAAGELQDAERLLRKILSAAPDHPPALHLLGVIAQGAGKTDLAIQLIEQAIRGDGKMALYHANLGEIHRRLRRYDKAVLHGRKAVALDPRMISAQSNLGIAYYDREEYEQAEACHRAALALDPHCAPSLNNIGSTRRKKNRDKEAHEYFLAAIAADPQYLDAQNNLGEILTRLDQPEEALKILDGVLRLNPRLENAHSNVGLAFLALGNEAQAWTGFRRALSIDPDYVPAHAGIALAALEFHALEDGISSAHKVIALEPKKPDGYSLLGSLQLALGLTEEAEASFRQGLSRDADYIPAKAGIGHILMEKGDLAGAEALFRSCLEKKSEEEDEVSSVLYSLIQVKKIKAGDPEIALLEKDAERLQGRLVDSKAIPLNYALGKMYDDLGAYEKGFPYYIAGARLKRKSFAYAMAAKQEATERTKALFTREFVAGLEGAGSDSDVPIFVLGMPRSGTTLTEQIIASHPAVFGAGELRDVPAMTEEGGFTFLERMEILKRDELKPMGDRYVQAIRRFSAGSPHITDKMPGNYHYLGLIHLMLPRAKIVHVMRDPLDTCLSCFTRLFAHGQANTYDLEEIGHAYKCYRELMDHWRAVLPAGSFYDVQYENIVDDTEAEARKLVAYCGLEWNEACLEFYKHKRNIRTASVTQVRQPIYKTSKQRWRNYEPFLAPLLKGLGSAMEHAF